MASLVKKGYELVATGLYATDDVWRRVTKEGLRLKSGKPVSKSYFQEMLHNKLYTGWIDKFGERHKGKFEAVVDEILFAQVQRVLKNKGHRVSQYKRDNADFPLRRFVFSSSGLKLTGSWSTGRSAKHPYYRFEEKGGNYQRDEFERQFAFKMDSYAFESEHVDKLKRFVKEEFNKATADDRVDAKKLHDRLEELEGEQTTLVQQNITGVVSDAVLKQELERVERDVADIHAALALLSNIGVSPEEAVEYAESYLLYPSSVWRKSDLAIQTKLQWFQFPSGVTFDGKEFGTAQIACVFKAKDLILSPMSTVVDFDLLFWNKFARECVQLSEILKEKESSTTDALYVSAR